MKKYLCKYCNIIITEFFDLNKIANHHRWCDKNPNRNLFLEKTKNLSFQRSKITKQSLEKMKEKIKKLHEQGKYKNSYKKIIETKIKNGTINHREETKKLLSEKARKSNHRRLVKSARYYKTKEGVDILLDSSWEEILARKLDSMNIRWIRPKFIEYIDKNGEKRKYFPDFYLPEYDIYIDPKNRIAMEKQKDKIEILKNTIKNLLFLTSKGECENFSIDFIKNFVINNNVNNKSGHSSTG